MSAFTIEKGQKISSLKHLLEPFTTENFLTNHLEKELLIIRRNDARYYESLFTIGDVDRVLDTSSPRGHFIRVVKNQEPLLASKFENQDGSLNLNQLYASYADGYTVVINEMERFWQPLKELCRNITAEMNHHVVGNMYLTPKNQKALLPHYDTHDVYVLQIHGKKHWRLYDMVTETPLLNSHQPVFRREQLSNMQEITLNAGDMMYMPRGLPHEAYTTDESSLHITIGVYPTQWIDLITQSFRQMAYANPQLRKALPAGFLRPETWNDDFRKEFEDTYRTLLTKAAEQVQPMHAMGLISEELRGKSSPVADGHFAMLDQIDEIDLDTQLKKRESVSCTVQNLGNVCRIIFSGNVIKGPGHIAETLLYIARSKGAFTLNDLPSISDTNKVKLAARLVRGGLLQIVK